ncbi:MAG: SulP family inorganic anion transporter [Saprospiraceae bacterium]|nr:SulP family inorganic anion transporter [Saprospiraceae bacterium]
MKFNFDLEVYRQSFRDDLSGAFLAAIIGLPMGLAFGVQSGLGAEAGIYTAVILAFIASLFGGTRTLISDPTGPMTVVAATIVTMGLSQGEGAIDKAIPLIIGTFVLAGVFQVIFGLFDFGKFVKFLPYPVLSGFMAGIGIIIISVQLFPILGYASPKGFLNIITTIDIPLSNINYQALFLGGFTITVIYVLPKITKKIPSILAALILGTGLSIMMDMDVPVIGAIPRALPEFQFSKLFLLSSNDIQLMITPAIMLGGLGVIDSLLTSVVADNMTKTKHNSKWTVIGQGIGNIFASLFGGIPGAGATMGTVTNIKSGARTKLSGVMKGVFLLVIVMGVADYVELIPMPVLAGILITIGASIIDYKGIAMLLKVPKQDAIVWSIVLLVTLFDNLLDAVGVGFTLASILFIGRMSKDMKRSHSTRTLKDMVNDEEIPAKLAQSINVQNLEGPLFFGFADQFREYCSTIDNVMVLILRMEHVPFLDQSGLVTLESVINEWHDRGIQVYITGANVRMIGMMKKVGVISEEFVEENCYLRFETCVKDIQSKIEGKFEIEQFETALLDKHVLAKRLKMSLN